MTQLPASWALGALMLGAGIGIPVMAALNAGLGARLGNPVLAAFILFLVGAAATGLVLLAAGMPSRSALNAPPHFFAGGLFVAVYILSVTFAAPHIGVGGAVFYVLIGQIVSATVIDHLALFGAVQTRVTISRAAGLVLMVAGAFLARRVPA